MEQLARFLAKRLRLPFEGEDDGAVFFGYLPERPVKAVCVYTEDLRAGGDAAGTRIQVAVRSDLDGAWPLCVAAEIMQALDGGRDVMLVPGGGCALRIEAEQGFEFSGMEGGAAQLYTARFRVYYCP